MKKKPFALVLDIYTTHIPETVKSFAESLNIELIYVPANGTGLFQPLDRRIFGILKQRVKNRVLHSDGFDEVEKHKELYGKMHQLLCEIWQSISPQAIESAWEIPGLPIEEESSKESYSEDTS